MTCLLAFSIHNDSWVVSGKHCYSKHDQMNLTCCQTRWKIVWTVSVLHAADRTNHRLIVRGLVHGLARAGCGKASLTRCSRGTWGERRGRLAEHWEGGCQKSDRNKTTVCTPTATASMRSWNAILTRATDLNCHNSNSVTTTRAKYKRHWHMKTLLWKQWLYEVT